MDPARISPELRRAAADPAIRGAALAVYIHCCSELDPIEYRAMKAASVAVACRLSDRTTLDALQRLTGRGYLEAHPANCEGQVGRFRLVIA